MRRMKGKVYLTKEDMPKSCMACPFCNGSDECILQDEDANFTADSFDDLRRGCPLEEFPGTEKIKLPTHLTQMELRKMDGQTVWCAELNMEGRVSAYRTGWINFVTPNDCVKAKDVTLYRRRPMGGH